MEILNWPFIRRKISSIQRITLSDTMKRWFAFERLDKWMTSLGTSISCKTKSPFLKGYFFDSPVNSVQQCSKKLVNLLPCVYIDEIDKQKGLFSLFQHFILLAWSSEKKKKLTSFSVHFHRPINPFSVMLEMCIYLDKETGRIKSRWQNQF